MRFSLFLSFVLLAVFVFLYSFVFLSRCSESTFVARRGATTPEGRYFGWAYAFGADLLVLRGGGAGCVCTWSFEECSGVDVSRLPEIPLRSPKPFRFREKKDHVSNHKQYNIIYVCT